MISRRAIPEFFRKWRSDWTPGSWVPLNYLDQPESGRVVIMAQWLFCPEVTEYRGGVYRADSFDPANVDRWMQNAELTIPAIEEVNNRIKFWDLFAYADLDELGPHLEELARSVATCWRGTLADAFPGRSFVVHSETEEDGVYGPGVTFFSG